MYGHLNVNLSQCTVTSKSKPVILFDRDFLKKTVLKLGGGDVFVPSVLAENNIYS